MFTPLLLQGIHWRALELASAGVLPNTPGDGSDPLHLLSLLSSADLASAAASTALGQGAKSLGAAAELLLFEGKRLLQPQAETGMLREDLVGVYQAWPYTAVAQHVSDGRHALARNFSRVSISYAPVLYLSTHSRPRRAAPPCLVSATQ